MPPILPYSSHYFYTAPVRTVIYHILLCFLSIKLRFPSLITYFLHEQLVLSLISQQHPVLHPFFLWFLHYLLCEWYFFFPEVTMILLCFILSRWGWTFFLLPSKSNQHFLFQPFYLTFFFQISNGSLSPSLLLLSFTTSQLCLFQGIEVCLLKVYFQIIYLYENMDKQ